MQKKLYQAPGISSEPLSLCVAWRCSDGRQFLSFWPKLAASGLLLPSDGSKVYYICAYILKLSNKLEVTISQWDRRNIEGSCKIRCCIKMTLLELTKGDSFSISLKLLWWRNEFITSAISQSI